MQRESELWELGIKKWRKYRKEDGIGPVKEGEYGYSIFRL
jgi:hypothetical protein